MKISEIIAFICEACEEKYRRENTLTRAEYGNIIGLLDRIEDFLTWAEKQER